MNLKKHWTAWKKTIKTLIINKPMFFQSSPNIFLINLKFRHPICKSLTSKQIQGHPLSQGWFWYTAEAGNCVIMKNYVSFLPTHGPLVPSYQEKARQASLTSTVSYDDDNLFTFVKVLTFAWQVRMFRGWRETNVGRLYALNFSAVVFVALEIT